MNGERSVRGFAAPERFSFSGADTALHLHVFMMFSRSRKSTGEYYLYQARGERICIHLTMFAKDDEFIKMQIY